MNKIIAWLDDHLPLWRDMIGMTRRDKREYEPTKEWTFDDE